MGVRGGRRPASRGVATGRDTSDEPRRATLGISDLHDPLFQALLQETRLRMLALLSSPEAHRRGGFSLQEIGALLDCSPQNAHHHLKILDEAGVVRIARSEPTQRIPRQFWVSDIQRVALMPHDGSSFEVAFEGLPRADAALDRRLREEAERLDAEGLARLAEIGIGTFLASLTYEEAAAFVRILRERADSGLRREEMGPPR